MSKNISDILVYINNANEIYTKGNSRIIGYTLKYGNGSRKVRLHVCTQNGNVNENDSVNGNGNVNNYENVNVNISDPIEIQISSIRKDIDILCNYMYLDRYRDIPKIRSQIETSQENLPDINIYNNTGYQRNRNGDIICYNGAKCYDGKGTEINKDMFAGLPEYRGNAEDAVNGLNGYMVKNASRQIVLLCALSGAICGMVKHNIILALVGESSRGKTTLMKMGVSFFGQPDYDRTNLTWASTQNALVKRMDGLSGVNVVVDDTQLSKSKTFQNVIYNFASGESIDRLEKGSKLGDKCHWYVSMGITAEKSLVDTFEDKGAVGRIIEMCADGTDLFDNETEARDIQNLFHNNYGVVGTEFIRCLLKEHGEDEICRMVKEEGARAVEKYKKTIDGDALLIRHAEGDIAVMTVAAKLANKHLGFDFSTELVQEALVNICLENKRTFEQNKPDEISMSILYQNILAAGRKEKPEYERDGKIIITSKLMKACIDKYRKGYKLKAADIKSRLCAYGYLNKHKNTYCWSHTINTESVSGYEFNTGMEG